MKRIKLKKFILTFSIISLLILSTIGSFGISINTVENDQIKKLNSNHNGKVVNAQINSASVKISNVISNGNEMNTLGISYMGIPENILISGWEGNESYPSMVLDRHIALIGYEYETGGDKSIYLRNSRNYGNNWNDANRLEVRLESTGPIIDVRSPSISFSPKDNLAYGTFVSSYENFAVNGIFWVSNIGGEELDVKGEVYLWADLPYNESTNKTYDFWNFTKPKIVAFDNLTTPSVVALIGSTNYTNFTTGEGPCNNSPMFLFRDLEKPETYIALAWFPEFENCSNISIANDFGNETIYGVCEIKNSSQTDLMFFEGNPDRWYYGEDLKNLTFSNPGESLYHPHIFVKGDHIYIAADIDRNQSHEIILYHSNNSGKNWTISNIVTNQIPNPDFTYSADRLDVTFTDISSDDDGYITSWKWDFGDFGSSTEQNPAHSYAIPGLYSVNLTVRDDDNSSNSIIYTINVDDETPIADFTYSPLKPNKLEDISFNDTSISYNIFTNDNWLWEFGDGVTSTEQNATHNYIKNGTYIVSLVVKNETIDKPDSIEKEIKVGLVADFTYEPRYPSIDDEIQFNDSSSDSHGNVITNWTWDFGDGSDLNKSQNTTYQFLRPDVYSVNLTIKNNLNYSSTITKEILIRPGKMMPRYPKLFANETLLFCNYVENGNIFIKNSLDDGTNWNNPIQLNSYNYSVVEEHRFSDMPGMENVVWTDHRKGNYDLYSISLIPLETDVLIIPGSVMLARDDTFYFLRTNNWIEFTIYNNGSTPIEYVPISIEYIRIREGKYEHVPTQHPEFIRYLSANYELPFRTPLFRINIREFMSALINFAGIEYINITVDPNNTLSDINPSNNIYTLPDVTYGKIFPLIGMLFGIE